MHPTETLSRARPHTRRAALAVAALLLATALSPARADITGFSDFAPINQSLEDPNATVYNGYYNDGAQFQLTTNGVNGQGVTGFANKTQNIEAFTASYTYLATHGGSPADGVAFVVQNDPRGTAALGDRGGSMGVGGAAGSKIDKSAATYLSVYYSPSAIAFGTNGNNNGYFYTGNANARNQYPVDVRVTYANGNWLTTIRDGSTGRVYTRSDAIAGGLPGVVGSNTAYVGFGGGTGGLNANQTVSNFKFQTMTTGSFNPIAVSGFTHDAIVEAGATNFQTAVTATVDNGSTRDANGNLGGATFYEQGFVAASPTTGLPSAGKAVVSNTDGKHSFSIASALSNNALMLRADTPSGTLTFDKPAKYSALSVLTTTGNGSGGFDLTVHFADGSPDEKIAAIVSPDWFNNAGAGILAAGRVNPNLTTDNVGATNPRLYQQDLVLTNTESPIASLTFDYIGGSGNTFVFGVSGVPEPGSAGLLAAAAIGLLAKRRRAKA